MGETDATEFAAGKAPTRDCAPVVNKIPGAVEKELNAQEPDTHVITHVETCTYCAELFAEAVEQSTGTSIESLLSRERGQELRWPVKGLIAVWLKYLQTCNLREDDIGKIRALRVLAAARRLEGDEEEALGLESLTHQIEASNQAALVAASTAASVAVRPGSISDRSPGDRFGAERRLRWLAAAAAVLFLGVLLWQGRELSRRATELGDIAIARDTAQSRVAVLERELAAERRRIITPEPSVKSEGQTATPEPPPPTMSKVSVAIPRTAATLGGNAGQSVIVRTPVILPPLELDVELPELRSGAIIDATIVRDEVVLRRSALSVTEGVGQHRTTISLTPADLERLFPGPVRITLIDRGHASIAAFELTLRSQ